MGQVRTGWAKSELVGTSRSGLGQVGTGWCKSNRVGASRNGMQNRMGQIDFSNFILCNFNPATLDIPSSKSNKTRTRSYITLNSIVNCGSVEWHSVAEQLAGRGVVRSI